MTAMSPQTSPDSGDLVLRLSRRFKASRRAVFAAFTDPAALAQWWGPEGMTAPLVELDVRPGGRWRTCMRNASGEDYCAHGVYQEVEPPARLVMTWIWESDSMAGMETCLTLEFTAVAEDETELRLTHAGLPRPESRDRHEEGWTSSFTCLAAHLAG